MSDREKTIAEQLKKALPNMSEFNRGYMMCLIETNAVLPESARKTIKAEADKARLQKT
jgi:hypothetical protein